MNIFSRTLLLLVLIILPILWAVYLAFFSTFGGIPISDFKKVSTTIILSFMCFMGIIHGFKGNLYEKNKNVFNIIYFGGGIIFFVIIFNSILIY